MFPLLLGTLLLSAGSGDTLVRNQQGTIVPIVAYRGPLIADDAGTVCHATWNGAGIQDSRGCAWAMQGTVPQVAKSGKLPPGAGPFSDTNHYTLGTGNDALDLSGAEFSACFVLAPSSADLTTPFAIPFSNGVYNTSGYFWSWVTGGSATFYESTTANATTATVTAAGVLTVACIGRSGDNLIVKLNGGATVMTQTPTWRPGTTVAAYLGRYGALTGRYMTGTLYEAWWSTTPASDALFTAIMQRVKLRAQITAW